MALDIVEIGHPVLRETASEVLVKDITSESVQRFIDQLIETKRAANGAGIAANQVNNTWRIYVVEVGSNPRYPYKPSYPLTVMINPKITFQSESRFHNFEGCLSIPNLRAKVERCPEIRVEGFDRHARAVDIKVKGISAGTFQHEQDHLDGVLFTDKIVDPHSLCTWAEFALRHEETFSQEVKRVVAQYGS